MFPRKQNLIFAVRRLLAGIVIIPIVAVAYFVLIALLVVMGSEPTATAEETLNFGLVVGVAVHLMFSLSVLFRSTEA